MLVQAHKAVERKKVHLLLHLARTRNAYGNRQEEKVTRMADVVWRGEPMPDVTGTCLSPWRPTVQTHSATGTTPGSGTKNGQRTRPSYNWVGRATRVRNLSRPVACRALVVSGMVRSLAILPAAAPGMHRR